MAGRAADRFSLDIDEDEPAVLGEASRIFFSETFEGEHHFTHSDISPILDFETLTIIPSPAPAPGPGSLFETDDDHDHDLAGLSPSRSPPWERILHSASTSASVPGGGSGMGGGQGDRDILGLIEGIDSGDESIFSINQGPELDDIFRSVELEQQEVFPELGEDGFEVLPEDMDEAEDRGAPPAARAAVEQLQVVAISRAAAAQGCVVCPEGFNQGDLATQMPCNHFYHEGCIRKWLDIRNSCPVCRYELPTDDPDYEEERARRTAQPD